MIRAITLPVFVRATSVTAPPISGTCITPRCDITSASVREMNLSTEQPKVNIGHGVTRSAAIAERGGELMSWMVAPALVALLSFYGDAAAQSRPRSASQKPKAVTPLAGRVEGDAYLVMKSGDIRKLAASRVFLAEDTANFQTVSLIMCDLFKDRLKRVDNTPNLNYLAKALTKRPIVEHFFESVDSALIAASRESQPSGVNAHYVFDRVPPGTYTLWMPAQIAETRYLLRTVVTLKGDSPLRADLDNSTDRSFVSYCGATEVLKMIDKTLEDMKAK